ncbi:MAG: phytanoyl-CoA dioxygenase family protein [Lentisphaeria bacterium]|nr:phytanoyl-CoA dioxygenase family protein [Lentisphaeria bacterium]
MNSDAFPAALEDRGFYIAEDLIDQATIAAAVAEVGRLHELYIELEAQDPESVEAHFMIEPFAQSHRQTDGMPVLRKIEQVQIYSDFFERLPRTPALVDLVSAFIGPDILLFRNTLMLKPGNHGSAHRLHQDSPYWHMEPATQITVSIALTDATIDNGCFQVIPGSHKSGLQDWGAIFRASNTLTDRDDIDLSSLIQVPLRAGSAIFFDSKLVHGSAANTTPNPRNTALYAYFPPNVRYCPPEGYGSHQKTCPVIRGCGGQSELVFTPE